jgi:hypothetical protein
MKPLAYLLGAQALDLARTRSDRKFPSAEPPVPPLASTPETAAAWRRWAAGRRSDASATASDPGAASTVVGRPGPASRTPA